MRVISTLGTPDSSYKHYSKEKRYWKTLSIFMSWYITDSVLERNERFYLCGLNLRETCRKLRAFLLVFQMSRLFDVVAWTQSGLSWCGSVRVNSLMLQLLWKMSFNTRGNGRFFIYVIDKAILIPLIPGFAFPLLHMCLCMLALQNSFALV